LGERAFANARRSAAPRQLAQAEFMLGLVALYQSEYSVARTHLQASADQAARGDDTLGNAWARTFLGATEIAAGELAAAGSPLEQAANAHRTNGDHIGRAHALQYQGVLAAA